MPDRKIAYYDDNGKPVYETAGVKAALATMDAAYAKADALGLGALKGAGRTVVGAGQIAADTPLYTPTGKRFTLADLINAGYNLFGAPVDASRDLQATLDSPALTAQNPDEQTGMDVERVAEFALLPSGKGKLLARAAVNAAGAAGLTAAQGGNADTTTTAAAMGAAVPVAGAAIPAVGRAVASVAVPLVRSALKPTVTAMKQASGASRSGIDVVANRMAKFIVDNRLATPEKAETMIAAAEAEVQRILAGKNPVTSAGEWAERYLFAIRKSAQKQGIPSDDVAAIDNKIRQFMKSSPLTEDVPLLDALGNQVFDKNGVPQMTRAARTDVTAKEALDTARASSRWSTKKQWGEQKGAATEADKAVERASRDAVKAAVPELRAPLKTEGSAIQAKQALARMQFRMGNNNLMDLPSHIIGAAQIARGQFPSLGVVSAWLGRNKLRAGMYADALGEAIASQNTQRVAEIVGKLGVGAEIQDEIAAQPNPAAVALADVGEGRHTLSDGSVWHKLADGSVVQVK